MTRRYLVGGLFAAGLLALLSSCATTDAGRWQKLDTAAQPASFAQGAGFVEGTDFRIERTVAPGVRHRFESFSSGPITRNTIFADLSRPDLKLEGLKGGDTLKAREPLLDMVKRTSKSDDRPVAAVNSAFWGEYGIPINVFVHQEMIWRNDDPMPHGRVLMAWDDKKNIFIGLPDLEIALGGPGAQIRVDSINVPGENARTTLYTWPVGAAAPPVPAGQKQVVFELPAARWVPNEAQTVTVRSVDSKDEVTFQDRRTLVLQTRDALPDWLHVGATARLQATFSGLPGPVVGAVGGAGWLLDKGEVIVTEKPRRDDVGDSFVTDLHPRTAAGLMPDGHTLVFVVVDGRQTGLSVGNSLPEMAQYFKELGCLSAINLDGGGSSSMVVEGEVVNFPSDAGGARSVTSGLAIRRTVELGEPVALEVSPADVTVPAHSTYPVGVKGRDSAGEEVPLDGWDVDYRLKAKDGAAVRVEAKAHHPKHRKPISGYSTVTVKPADAAHFHPTALLLDPEEKAEITLQASDTAGTRFFANAVAENITVPDFVTWDSRTRTVTALKPGFGNIVANFGTVTATLPVAVGQSRDTVVLPFEELPASPDSWMKLQNADAKRSHLTLETTTVKEGKGAWRWDYAMAKGGTTKLALPLALDLPGDPLAVGVWIYGDGEGQWLRGILRDGNGTPYYLNFTSQAGVTWRGEWRFVKASLLSASPVKSSTKPLAPPYKLEEIYIVQPQEAAKRDGTFILDGLTVLNLPEAAGAPPTTTGSK